MGDQKTEVTIEEAFPRWNLTMKSHAVIQPTCLIATDCLMAEAIVTS